LGLLTARCSSGPPPPVETPLLGSMKAVVSVKELMQNLLDPMSDNIFEAVATDVTAKGIVETAPKTDADWAKVRMGAIALAEGVNLLEIPRPFAPPGDLNNSAGPDAPELSPAAIQAKVDGNRALWNSHVEELRAVAVEAMEVVTRKDVGALLDVGDKLDKACENCHLEYWYPGDKKALERAARNAALERRTAAGAQGK
ncbi:MAG: hypothetical protein ABUS56_13360, partial [Acidobacteriota bacterium]